MGAPLAAISFPILERIPLFGDAAVSPHGLGIAIGFALGAVLMIRRAEKRGLGFVHEPNISEAIQELLTRAALGAIIGARGFYVLTHLSDFEGRWHEVLYAWQGGLTFLGGVTGAILLAIPFARRKGWRLTMLLDSAAPGIALGLGVGRIGDLIIGDHIGAPTDFPLAWKCTANYWVRATNSFGAIDPLPYPTTGAAPTAGCYDVALHHTALYDFGATVIVLLVLLAMERKRWFDGAFIAAWVYVYGALRFASDFARQDKTWFGLTGSQWALVGAAALVTAWLLKTKPWARTIWAWDLQFDHPWKREGFTAADLEADGAATSESGESRQTGEADAESLAAFAAPSPMAVHPGVAPEVVTGDVARADVAPDGGASDGGASDGGAPDGEASPADEPVGDEPRTPPGRPIDLPGLPREVADRVTRSTDGAPKMASRPRKDNPRSGA